MIIGMKIGATISFLSILGAIACMGIAETPTVPWERRRIVDRVAGWLGLSAVFGISFTIVSWIWS